MTLCKQEDHKIAKSIMPSDSLREVSDSKLLDAAIFLHLGKSIGALAPSQTCRFRANGAQTTPRNDSSAKTCFCKAIYKPLLIGVLV